LVYGCGVDNAITEFPFVEAMPKREKSRIAKLWDEFSQMREAMQKAGGLVPPVMAAELAGVSHQRIWQLVEAGKLERVEFCGRGFITGDSFEAWAKSERKNGRPLKEPASKGDFVAKFGCELAKEALPAFFPSTFKAKKKP